MDNMMPTLKINHKRKSLTFSSPTAILLGSPPYLFFMLDVPKERLIALPSFEKTENTFELSRVMRKGRERGSRNYRLPFFINLHREFQWKSDRVYTIEGIFQILDNQRLMVFNFSTALRQSRFCEDDI